MIDLTPLDVRKKRGDFRRILRGYDPDEVDHFLELVAERMEELVRENFSFSERIARLQEQVGSLEGREKAVHEALVTAEKLRGDVKEQARREAEVILREAEADARRRREDGERAVVEQEAALAGLRRERRQFLMAFRSMLERQVERLDAEEQALAEEAEGPPPRRGGRGAPYAAGRGRWVRSDDGEAESAPPRGARVVPVESLAPDPVARGGEQEARTSAGTAAPPEAPDDTEQREPAEEEGAVAEAAVPLGASAVEGTPSVEALQEGDATPSVASADGPQPGAEDPSGPEAPEPEGDREEERVGGQGEEVEDLSRWLASFLEDEEGRGR